MGYNSFFLYRSIFMFLWYAVFIFVFSTIIYRLIISIKQNIKNNNSPILDVNAIVVTKRNDMSTYGKGRNEKSYGNHYSRTTYFTTFEFESGDRLELQVGGKEYGMIKEGDKGILKFQGTRYLQFNRNR